MIVDSELCSTRSPGLSSINEHEETYIKLFTPKSLQMLHMFFVAR